MFDSFVEQPLVKENPFIGMKPEDTPPPPFEQAKSKLPEPFWDGHDTALACYWKTWEMAFRNLRRPTAENGFVASYIDTAFNDNLFMWDSAFILLFCRYGARAFPFQRTLDNLYCKQHASGFICREISEADGNDTWHEFDPSATGPAVMPWTEWEYFQTTGDKERLALVYPPLAAFHLWMRAYRTWPDGSYWATGLACGMDNQPRVPEGLDPGRYHAHLAWADTCLQQLFSADLLARMAELLGRGKEAEDFRREHERLKELMNSTMWDEKDAFYYDRASSGSLTKVKSVGAFWALLADAAPKERMASLIAHLEDEKEFKRPHRVPSLAANHADYHADGGYWRGGVWPPTTYTVLRGLTRWNRDALAHEIGVNHHANVVKVFEKTRTVFENYAPETPDPGKPAKADFVGWGGLGPVAVFLEYVLGIRADVPAGKLVWDVRLLEGHGVKKYPFGVKGEVALACAPRRSPKEEPRVEASSNTPLDLFLKWEGGTRTIRLGVS